MLTAPAPRSLTRRALLAAVTLLVLALAMLGMETAHALWQDQVSVESAPVTTGTAAVTAQWSSQNDAEAWQNLLPGDQVQRDLIVKNTGDVPLALEASTANVTFEVQLSESGLVLEPGEQTTMQVELTATTGLTPDAQDQLEIQIDGTQTA